MDSRLIYKVSAHMRSKVTWDMETVDSEWIYCGTNGEVKKEFVERKISEHFTDSKLYVVFTREESFEIPNHKIMKSIEKIIGSHDFLIWDSTFNYAIEFNDIGIFRKGKVN